MRAPLCFFPMVLVSLVAAGCALDGAEGAEDAPGEARSAQLDPGFLNARRLRFTFADRARTPFAEVHILNHASGGRVPGVEYWYVNRAATGLLATSSLDLTVSDVTIDPPIPDYPSTQAFTEVEYPTSGWGSGWTTDPLGYGRLFGNGNGVYLRLATSTSGDLSRVAWSQVIPMTQSPVYLTPSGHFVGYTGGAPVPGGYRGYDIDQAVP